MSRAPRLSPVVGTILALVLLAAASSAALAEERSSPREVADRVLGAALPARDPVDLAFRLRGISSATPRTNPVPAAPLIAGFTDTFWVLDQTTARLFQA